MVLVLAQYSSVQLVIIGPCSSHSRLLPRVPKVALVEILSRHDLALLLAAQLKFHPRLIAERLLPAHRALGFALAHERMFRIILYTSGTFFSFSLPPCHPRTPSFPLQYHPRTASFALQLFRSVASTCIFLAAFEQKFSSRRSKCQVYLRF